MGADINKTVYCREERSTKSALTISIERRDSKTTHLLLNAGASVNNPGAENCLEITALTAAVRNNDVVMVEELLARGADPNDSQAILAALSSTTLLEKLQEAYDRMYPRGTRGWASYALAKVVARNVFEMIERLLVMRPDVNQIVKMDYTRINKEGSSYQLFRYLSPLGVAITGSYVQMVGRLLEFGGDPNSIVKVISRYPREERAPALLAAIGTESIPIVQLLIDKGADVNRPAKLGIKRTPLQLAAQIGSFEIVQALLMAGADVNAEPAVRGGATALQLAAIGGYVGVVELLLQCGADPNAAAAKHNGRTALEGAAEHGRIDMLKVLHNAGAKMDQKQFDLASYSAEEEGHFATVKYLRTLFPEFLDQPIPPADALRFQRAKRSSPLKSFPTDHLSKNLL